MKTKTKKVLGLALLGVALVSPALATDPDPIIDYTTYTTTMSTALTVIGTVAAAGLTLKAGVVIAKKVIGYFSKAA